LPDDTLVLVTAPDFTKLNELYHSTPIVQLINDPAMKPFKDKFVSKWQDDFAQPLERELNIKLADYASLPQGQLTFALVKNQWMSGKDEQPGLILLIDTRDRSSQLTTNLTNLRKHWVDSGKIIKTEKLRGYEFSVLPMSSNDVPKTLKKFFPDSPEEQELAEDGSVKTTGAAKRDLVVGQAESLLIIGNSLATVEKVVDRLGGGSLPRLGEYSNYQENYNSMFRSAPAYGWVNVKAFLDLFNSKTAEKKDSDAPEGLPSFDTTKLLKATGLGGLKSVAFNLQGSKEGTGFQAFLNIPESSRQGLFKILAGESKEYLPPAFVPADATKYQRWRIDGKKSWAALETLLKELSPQAINALNFLIDTANTNAKEKDPNFDVRKNLIGNLGDDLVSYEKAPRGTTPAEYQNPPSIFLIGSPHPEELVVALKNILVFMSAQAGSPSEREFLNRKIYSIPVPSLPMVGGNQRGPARTLHYSASSGYVAFSTDAATLEEYLRSSDSQGKSLRETAGLSEAAQKVAGSGTSLFGYENQLETMRATFEVLKKGMNSEESSGALNAIPGAAAVTGMSKNFKEWADFSLLPPFERISKYFGFSVYAGSASVEGLSLKAYAPTPTALKVDKSGK